jgi:hypothetical protein
MELVQQFNKVLSAFHKYKVEYILIGGYAVILYGFPRLTQDIDIVIKMDEQNIKNLRKALGSVFHDESIKDITLQELKDYAVIRYGTQNGFYLDIIAGIGTTADYNSIEFIDQTINRIPIHIATPEALIRLKENTIHPHDKRDALYLKELIERKKNNAG